MLLHGLRSPVFGTNTLVLAAGSDGPAVVVDPGAGSAPLVGEVLRRHGLHVGAVVLTHGHADHLWDCAAVAGDAPVLIGADDADRLADPGAHLGVVGSAFASLAGAPWQPVSDVRPVGPGAHEPVPGVVLHAVAAPGHTPGSTLWRLDGVTALDGPAFAEAGVASHDGPVVLTGDVVFAGSVGRTDLPGGDEAMMRRTLRELASSLPAGALLVPGHGPATTTARELATNPFIARALA
ncbi:Glyoxylase, beta-lactamase superfamily II [Georgenia satyanarayanai]|uniref:Glyoxylase, beta-lactamase superfamily II n=1 Tax=Georgenia satyanarayanai TaxID=860221 RepID=A0A2Y9C2Y9_9MICO|nr:MBL fold metallo-hydrolase [Georgenia satyanarayanai]PYG02092.1 glyoxylase-like metal-dependent hydrolase (beta-lactamase superfamily II) [Georgenia satyanarayanai]SSA36903.1 Glyoxylase, beta-lactamase superfamily II [Georgenia satyanarayanai]